MISIKGHIRILENGKEPMDLTEYSENGFPELSFNSWEAFKEWGEAREAEERGFRE